MRPRAPDARAQTHPLAGVRDAFNAVFIEADAAGQVMFYGRGAGGAPTASAVLGDIVTAARNRVTGSTGPGESSYAELPVLPMGAATTAYFVHLRVLDRPGVLAGIAGVFAEHGASIRSMTQKGEGDQAELLILTHPGPRGRSRGDRGAAAGPGLRRRRRRVHAGDRGGAVSTEGASAPDPAAEVARVPGAASSTSTATGCPCPTNAPVITLCEGGTPLVESGWLSELTGCGVLLKFDGGEPHRVVQGPRDDDGHLDGRP